MNYLYLILNWIFGVFFLLAGLFFLIFSPLGGICLIATATLLLPAIRNFFYSKTQKAVPAKVRVASICVLIIAFGVFSNQSLNKKMQEVAEQQLQDKAKQEGKLIQDNIAYFNNNREQIILSIRTLYAAKEYQSVVSESNKYLVSSDKELEQLNRQAKEEILVIQKAERAAKAHAERILKINELLEKIKTIPQTEFIQHQEIYQQLLKFEPENQEYKEKLAYFSQKQSEYEKLKEEERLQKEKNIRFNLYIKMVDNAENRFKKNKESLKKYYSTEADIKQTNLDIVELNFIKSNFDRSSVNKERELAQKATTLLPKISLQLREMYASFTEDLFMRSGMDIDVSAIGKDKQQLKLSYPLMSQPIVYKLQNGMKVGEQAAPLGFKKIIFTNGFESSMGKTWIVDLE